MTLPELEQYFTRELPKELRLNDYTLIFDLSKMVKTHLEYLKNCKGKIHKLIMLPYYKRLILVKNELDKNS